MKNFLIALSVVLLFGACNAQAPISRENACWFLFDQTYHPTSFLFVAVQSPGSFAYVTTYGDGKQAARHVVVAPNNGSGTEDNIIRNAVEINLRYDLGVSNDIGLIIGCTNFDGLRAYDGSCPNCETPRPMSWGKKSAQQVTCGRCNRTYSLDTGNILEGEDGKTLLRYNCAYDGMTVRAWN